MNEPILTVETEIKCDECNFLMIRCSGGAQMVIPGGTSLRCRKCRKEHVFEPLEEKTN